MLGDIDVPANTTVGPLFSDVALLDLERLLLVHVLEIVGVMTIRTYVHCNLRNGQMIMSIRDRNE